MKNKIYVILAIVIILIIVAYIIYINRLIYNVENINTDTSNIENSETSVNVYDYYDESETVRQDETENGNIIYLWQADNIPTETNYTENTGNYFDDPDFVPYITVYTVPDGTEIKGAVLINPGGAFMFRSETRRRLRCCRGFE